MRSTDLAGCGHSTANEAETTAWLSDPATAWQSGSVTIWRQDQAVGFLLVEDLLHEGGGWTVDVYAEPEDPQQRTIQQVLIDAGLGEGHQRWAAMDPDVETATPIARSACYANDQGLRRDLEHRGFTEVRRYWQLKIDHAAADQPVEPGHGLPAVSPGYQLRAARDTPEEWQAIHALENASFAEHFDFTPTDFDTWATRMRMDIEDPALWLVAEHQGVLAGFALGSHRYASEGYGYVSALGVDRGHRGKGLARALLLARFAADRRQHLRGTLLEVDSTNPTGATRLYESVGMLLTAEFVAFHRGLLTVD